MMQALLDGRAWTASELAAVAGVARSTATEHLDRLVAEGLVAELRQGRHRYLRIATDDIAELVEVMSSLAARRSGVIQAPASFRAQRATERLRNARTCYRHLAGRLGVAIADGMRRHDFVGAHWELTHDGLCFMTSIGVTVPDRSTKPLLRPCLDWTERRDHLAGPVAEGMLEALLASGALRRGQDDREIIVTAKGRMVLQELVADDELAGSA